MDSQLNFSQNMHKNGSEHVNLSYMLSLCQLISPQITWESHGTLHIWEFMGCQ